jgi:hypothetical protein
MEEGKYTIDGGTHESFLVTANLLAFNPVVLKE